MGKDNAKTTINAIAISFLFRDKPETSSSGPGCLNMDMKTIRNAMKRNSVPDKTRTPTYTMVKTYLSLSGTIDLATCPPSSIAAGSRLSMVTTKPAQPAHAIGFKA